MLAEMIAIGGYEDVIGDAREAEVAGCRIKVLSLGHLIQTKRAADRPKDRAVLPELEAMLKLEKGSAEAEP